MNALILMRHGQTNPSMRYTASGRRRRFVPLNATGISAARAAAETVARFRPTAVMYSNFTRTAQTAAIVAPGVLPIRVDSDLDEVDYGDFDGRPWVEYGAWLEKNGLEAVPPGGHHSWMASLRRAVDALLRHREEFDSPLVICHGYLWAAITKFGADGTAPSPNSLGSAEYCTTAEVDTPVLRDLLSALPPNPGEEVPSALKVLEAPLRALGFQVTLSDEGAEFLYGDQAFLLTNGTRAYFAQQPRDCSHPDLNVNSRLVSIPLVSPHNTAFVVTEAARWREDLRRARSSS